MWPLGLRNHEGALTGRTDPDKKLIEENRASGFESGRAGKWDAINGGYLEVLEIVDRRRRGAREP